MLSYVHSSVFSRELVAPDCPSRRRTNPLIVPDIGSACERVFLRMGTFDRGLAAPFVEEGSVTRS